MAINTTTVECSTSPSLISPNIKQEMRDDRAKLSTSPSQQTSNASIAFSISNILSNNFGTNNNINNNNNHNNNNNNNNSKSVISDEKNTDFAFRPYDHGSSPSSKKIKFDRRSDDDEDSNDDEEIDVTDDRHNQNTAIDFSQVLPNNVSLNRFAHPILSPEQQAHQHHLHHQQLLNHYQAAMVVAQQSLQRAHGFMDTPIGMHNNRSPTIFTDFYAQNQEQTLAKQYQQYQQYYQTTSLLTDTALSKYAPLGNLCKTVSQIGQTPCTPPSVTSKLISPALSEPSPSKKPSLKRPLDQTTTTTSSPTLNDSNASTSKSTVSTNEVNKNTRLENMDSGMESSDDTKSETSSNKDDAGSQFPAWIYCTRYSDRPSSGPRYRKPKTPKVKGESDEKRPRTAFSTEQLARLKREFNENHYLNERRRQHLSSELGLNEAQIKIWFQNKRAKLKKTSGQKNPLAMQLMAQGLYNHSTVALTKEEEELEMRMNGQL